RGGDRQRAALVVDDDLGRERVLERRQRRPRPVRAPPGLQPPDQLLGTRVHRRDDPVAVAADERLAEALDRDGESFALRAARRAHWRASSAGASERTSPVASARSTRRALTPSPRARRRTSSPAAATAAAASRRWARAASESGARRAASATTPAASRRAPLV